jgi:cytochrome c oxidase cbb3-type subunit 3
MTPSTGIAMVAIASALIAGCDHAPGRRAIDAENVAPDKVLEFAFLYRSNCAGCHGADGHGGPATPLANPIYLAVADDAVVRRAAADGVPGTPMPAFARRSGGMLTDAQIDVIVTGIRARWTNPAEIRATNLPAYADPAPGDARRGGDVFATYCASCHGAGGRGGRGGSSIVDGSYLALVSDQGLRTTVIAGRPDLGAPDWRGNVGGRAMASQEISDVVAWLSAQRLAFPGQPH